MIKEIQVKTAIHYHQNPIPTNWDINLYRGCEHKCKYCFAQYSHKYLENDVKNFFNTIYVKTNIDEVLDIELSKKKWKRTNLINISGITDCYQPIEEKYQLMRKILKVLIKHKQAVYILTKSPLIYRDYDLINELSKNTFVNIAFSITTFNEKIRQQIEPNVQSSLKRIKILEKFSKLNCKTSIMFIPIIPYLTDTIQNIELIYKIANKINCDYVINGTLNMKGVVKSNFYDFLKQNFQTTYNKIQNIYGNSAFCNDEYSKKLYKIIEKMKRKYNVKSFTEFEKDYINWKNKYNGKLF